MFDGYFDYQLGCWQRIERMTIGSQKASSLSKMFRRAKTSWSTLLQSSIQMILSRYGITYRVLAIDDTANKHSKYTKRISKTHKTKDKWKFLYAQDIKDLAVLFLNSYPEIKIA